jgi:hypothetical protein
MDLQTLPHLTRYRHPLNEIYVKLWFALIIKAHKVFQDFLHHRSNRLHYRNQNLNLQVLVRFSGENHQLILHPHLMRTRPL